MQTAVELPKIMRVGKHSWLAKELFLESNTQEKFELYVALRSAASVGDKATVEKLSAQLGLGQKKMDGTGLRNGGGKGMGQRHSQ
jgi:hypothetical protein